jgi:hypothetical protein
MCVPGCGLGGQSLVIDRFSVPDARRIRPTTTVIAPLMNLWHQKVYLVLARECGEPGVIISFLAIQKDEY